MSDGLYLDEDYRFDRIRGRIGAFIWAEPEWYEEQLELPFSEADDELD